MKLNIGPGPVGDRGRRTHADRRAAATTTPAAPATTRFGHRYVLGRLAGTAAVRTPSPPKVRRRSRTPSPCSTRCGARSARARTLLQPHRLGAGREQFIAKQRRFRRFRLGAQGRAGRRRRRALRWQPGLEPAAGLRPDRDGRTTSRASTGWSLNGDTLAKIFQGQITKWNDPAIAALNEGATLPDTAITPIFRSDSSGTTDNFQKYLSAAAPAHGPRATAASSRAAPARARRSPPVSRRPCRRPRCHRLRGEGLRRSGRPALRPDRHRRRRGRADATSRAAQGASTPRQVRRPRAMDLDAGPGFAVRHQGGGRLPAGAGDLQDRLLATVTTPRRCGRQVVPDGRRPTTDRPACRLPAVCRCPTQFKERLLTSIEAIGRPPSHWHIGDIDRRGWVRRP